MIIEPRIRGFICMTAHPTGCAAHVDEQIAYVAGAAPITGPQRVLVLGASTGYGLASRISATFGAGADTVGVFFERPASGKRTASAGWYNTAAFEQRAAAAGRGAWSINGDAFSTEVTEQTIELVRRHLRQVDLVVYSLAAPRRIEPVSGVTYSSVLKPIGAPYRDRTVDPQTGRISEVAIEPATDEEIDGTVAVMGGADWSRWLYALQAADVLAPGCINVAYSYLGPEFTHQIYRSGTIGRAKEDLEATALRLDAELPPRSLISVNKALVTQAAAAIPVIPLYIMLLFKVMKAAGTHEDAIAQMHRLLAERLYAGGDIAVDEAGRTRVDDYEMHETVQREVAARWARITEDNLSELGDVEGYRSDFLKLFGFGLPGVDYAAEVDAEVAIPSIA